MLLTLLFTFTVICLFTVLFTRILTTVLVFRCWLRGCLGVLNFWSCDGASLSMSVVMAFTCGLTGLDPTSQSQRY
jgi:hypothetical protein